MYYIIYKNKLDIYSTLNLKRSQNEIMNPLSIKQIEEGLKTERHIRPEKPLTQNFMVMHRKNVNSNDGRIKPKDQFYNDLDVNRKELYDEARKQNKRPKSSSNLYGPTKKVSNKKPIIFATIDNRNPNALISQNFCWKDTKSIPPTLV